MGSEPSKDRKQPYLQEEENKNKLQKQEMDSEEDVAEKHCNEANFYNDILEEIDENKMKDQLHRHIGLITFTSAFEDKMGNGTGILISPNLVLTVAHNVYNCETNEVFQNLRFYYRQSGKLGKANKVCDIFVPGKYGFKPNAVNDYALLKLSEKINVSNFIPLCGETA